jgi:type IV pilus assembly protein PilC
MTNRFWRISALVSSATACGALLVAVLMYLGLGYPSLLMLLGLAGVYGCLIFAYWHYRDCRQEEFLQVLAAAADAQAPLAPALWAYLHDRPSGGLREAWVFVVLFFVLPGYYWLWYSGSSFDRKVERVAGLLEEGHSLHGALVLTPGVASSTTRLAVALGEETGQLSLCLRAFRSPARSRLAGLWLELVPRIAYPLVLLLVISGILAFWAIFLAPKYQVIFRSFKLSLPQETWRTFVLADLAERYAWVLVLAVAACAALLVVLLISPGVRWYFPVVGRLYRGYVASQILQALAFLLQVGQPAPHALYVLSTSDSFVGGAWQRMQTARRRIEQGEPLAESLRAAWLLPRAMVPLLHTAERAGNLPWALAEIADVLGQRAVRRVQRFSLVFFPVPIVGVGVIVGVVVIGFFQPLITLIEGLTP